MLAAFTEETGYVLLSLQGQHLPAQNLTPALISVSGLLMSPQLSDRQDLSDATAQMSELFKRVKDIQQKAADSEVLVQEICRDIRKVGQHSSTCSWLAVALACHHPALAPLLAVLACGQAVSACWLHLLLCCPTLRMSLRISCTSTSLSAAFCCMSFTRLNSSDI